MGTRSILAARMSDGSIKAIYVHYDGDSHLSTLKDNYNSQDKVDELIALGDLRTLGTDAGYCKAFSRDCGGSYEDNAPTSLDSFQDMKDLDWNQEYYYTWDGTQWQGFHGNGDEILAVIKEEF